MEPILVIDKPTGMTSHDVVQIVKRELKARRVGHAGTLDPLATGVLIVGVDSGTRRLEELAGLPKQYRCLVKLGVRTETGDSEGKVVEQRPVPAFERSDVERVLGQFVGKRWQTPPAYSAVKYRGRPLYKWSRQGVEVPRRPRQVEIEQLTLRQLEADRICFDVSCSKGTYIRVLAEEISRALGTVGHVAALRRTACGPFTIEAALSLESFRQLTREKRLC